MEIFPTAWHMPEYPLATIVFMFACFIFAWSTYNFVMGMALHGRMVIDKTSRTFTGLVYHYSVKVGLWGGSLSFTYMMMYLTIN